MASPAPRRDDYRFKPGGWSNYLREWLRRMSELHAIAERPPDFQERLLEAHDLFSALEAKFPAILEELETERRNRTQPE